MGAKHRDVAQARCKEERTKFIRNAEVDRPAKMATRLPRLEYKVAHVGNIAINEGPAPVRAKEWADAKRRYDTFLGTLWVSWLPRKGTWRMVWANRATRVGTDGEHHGATMWCTAPPRPLSGKLSCRCTPQRSQVSAAVGKPNMDSECASGCPWSMAQATARLWDGRPPE